MRVGDVMTKDVRTIEKSETLERAAREMAQHGVGSLPVCQGGSVVGIITDRDIVTHGIARGMDPHRTPVATAMTEGIDCCFEEQSTEEAGRAMEQKGLRRLVVVDAHRHVVGLVSWDDLSVLRAASPERTALPTSPFEDEDDDLGYRSRSASEDEEDE